MSRSVVFFVIALAAYLASGWYIVGGNEKAVVRRFGRMVTPLRGSGLHYDLPWPWSRVDRVKLNEVRTISFGEPFVPGDKLLIDVPARTSAFLTGDKNVLIVTANVQYELLGDQIATVLFSQTAFNERLQSIVEFEVTQIAGRCGVDYLHTFGLVEVNQRLTRAVRQAVQSAQLGVEIHQVTLERVEPPARVQADFLDVANARAEAARAVHEARTAAEQQVAAATSKAAEWRQQALQQQLARVSQAQGAAARFTHLVSQIDEDAQHAGRESAETRRLAIQRLTTDALQQALGKVAKRVIVDSQAPIDLNLQGGPLPVSP